MLHVTAADVIGIYTEWENLNIKTWVDGGWDVDALLGEQTRPHQDLDIVVQQEDVPRLRHMLQERGFRDIKLTEAKPWNCQFAGKTSQGVAGENHPPLR